MSDVQVRVSERLRRLPLYLFGKLNALRHDLRRQGHDIIDLGMGNPNDPTPGPIVEKLCEAVQDPRNQRYSVSVGVYNLRREVAKHYKAQWDVDLDPVSEVVTLVGSKEGYSHMCLALLGPGDTALVPDPAFPIHGYGIVLAGANVISVPLSDERSFFDDLRRTAENLYPRPKLIVLNYPNNPTTATVEPAFFEEMVEFARELDLMVIHDFAYAHTVFDDYRAPSFLQAPGAKDVGVEFITMSKPFNMAGWRIGFCVGNAEMLAALAKIKGYYDYGCFQAVQIASIIALRECMDHAAAQAAAYQARRDVLCDGLNKIGWEIEPPKASMFVWAPIPERFAPMGSVEFAMKLMREAEVAVAPGRGFGERGEGYLRFALVENEQRLKQAVRQIGRVMRTDGAARAQ